MAKQVDIRENNKSLVIDLLLEKQASLPEMVQKFGLSHTALRKVVRELTEQGVVYKTDETADNFGRPSCIYDIEKDCGIAAAVNLAGRRIEVFYLDMKGFEVDTRSRANDFSTPYELVGWLRGTLAEMREEHPRLAGKQVHYLYLSLPPAGLSGMNFAEAEGFLREGLSGAADGAKIVAERDVDLILAAERKYGHLQNVDNAALLNLGCTNAVGFLLDGSVFRGTGSARGVLGAGRGDVFGRLADRCGGYEALGTACREGRAGEAEVVFGELTEGLAETLRFLDIDTLILSGEAAVALGEELCKMAAKLFPAGKGRVLITSQVRASLAGAVWLATYNTLKEIILR